MGASDETHNDAVQIDGLRLLSVSLWFLTTAAVVGVLRNAQIPYPYPMQDWKIGD